MELINLTTELDKKIEEFSARKSRYNLSTLLQKVIAAANQGLKYEVLTQAPHNHTLAEIRGVEAKRNCKPQDFFTTLAGRMVNFPIIGNLARNFYNTNVIDINQQVGIDRSVLEALKSTSMPTTLPEACITCSRGLAIEGTGNMAHCFDLSNYLSRINTVKGGIVEYIDTLTQNQEDNTFEIDTVEPLRLQVNGRRLADEMPEVVVSRADMAEEVLASLYHLNAYSEAGSAFDRNQYTMYIRSFQIGGQQFLVHEPYTKYSSKSTREDIKNMEVRNRFAALELKKRKVFTFCNMPWDAKLEPNLNGYLMQSLLLGMKTIDLINVDKPNIVELNAGNGLVSLFLGSKLPQGNILLHNAPGGREFDNYSRIANFNLIPSTVSRSKDKNLGNVVGSATHLVINDLMGVDQTVLVDILKKSNTLKYVLVSGVLDENNIFTDSNIMEELRNIGYEQSGYCETTYKRNNRTFSSYVLTRV